MTFDPVLRQSFDHIPLPVMYPAEVRFAAPEVRDLALAVYESLQVSGILTQVKPGMRIAIGVGSRGVARIPELACATVNAVRQAGAEPFLIPAMGSHGGATSEGQRQVLADLGVTEDSVGAPIRTEMDVVELGRLPEGVPVCMDRNAYAADATILINRIKPHTDFHGPIESGLAKMCVIGLGKVPTAEALHMHGPDGLRDLIVPAARIVVERGRVLGGIASIENAYHGVAEIVGVPAVDIGGVVEQALLQRSRELMAALPFDHLDVLVVDEMGKDISGTGMDTNVIGRMFLPGVPEPARPQINAIATLSLTEATHGNAVGFGFADVVTERFFNQMDWRITRVNALTSGVLGLWRGKLPWVTPDDATAIRLALRLCGWPYPEKARMMRIRNTLSLSQVWISQALLDAARATPHVTVAEQPIEWAFDAAGRLTARL